jgi:hypothetical protein
MNTFAKGKITKNYVIDQPIGIIYLSVLGQVQNLLAGLYNNGRKKIIVTA